jgi:acetyl esterase/lipase
MEEKYADCYVVDAGGASPRNVTVLPPQQGSYDPASFLWDDKGEQIFFIHNGALWKSCLKQCKAVEIARIPRREIRHIIATSNHLLWISNGRRSVTVVTHDAREKQDGFYKIDLESGESDKLLETGQCYTCALVAEPFAVTSDGREMAYFAEDAQQNRDIWVNDASFENPRRLTHLNPQFDKYRMGSTQLIDWVSDDGEQLQGALLLPADYGTGRRYPLIVYVYGGLSLSDNLHHFGLAGPGPFNMQLFSTRGYAVLLPDAPQHLGTPMADLTKTVLPGINKVVEMGLADPSRLGVMGHSYGGYSVLSLIVQTKRFKAAVEADGYADLVGHFGEMRHDGTAIGTSLEEQGQGLMGLPPWQFPGRYIQNSPIFYLDRVETPLLMVHGSRDDTVAPFLGDEVFVGLRRLGRQVEYALYEDEGHSPPYWNFANQVDFCNRVISWFELHLHKEIPPEASSASKVRLAQ